MNFNDSELRSTCQKQITPRRKEGTNESCSNSDMEWANFTILLDSSLHRIYLSQREPNAMISWDKILAHYRTHSILD